MKYTYKTKGTCAAFINFELDGDQIKNVEFYGGCNGNLTAISKLINGMDAEKVEDVFTGNLCGFKNTSCADQLAKAIHAARNGELEPVEE